MVVSAATASTGGAGATSSPPEEEAVAVSAAAVEEEECVADAGSISQLSELSEFKLLDSSKMMSSLSSKHSALRVIRSGLIPPEDDPPPPPQQIPESSEPRLDWSKLDDVEIPADTMPLPIAESIPDVDFCNSTPQPEEEVPQELTGSALPHTAPNLNERQTQLIPFHFIRIHCGCFA